MPHDWILEVLDDLRGFAGRNGLPLLAGELKAAAEVAALELANLRPGQEAEAPPLELVAANRGAAPDPAAGRDPERG